MSDETLQALREVVEDFRVGGEPEALDRLGSGHIHDTYVSRVRTPDGIRRFVHQRINRAVFPSPTELMENLLRVTRHLQGKIAAAGGDPQRETLTVVETKEGGALHVDAVGESWRTFRFIEGARTHDAACGADHAYQAAAAFARFVAAVGDLPGPPLHETIPGFGDTRRRFDAFRAVLDADPLGRAGGAGPEIDFALRREDLSVILPALLRDRLVPERIVHHDTKINNVLIDDDTGRGLCVIDLDTVMPGTILHDFGDAVRAGATRAREDEPDAGSVSLDEELFEALVRGYTDVLRGTLTAAELEHMVEAARIVTFIVGLRFLTDHLAGDGYFRIGREGQNLDRCRTQFALVREVEDRSERLRSIVTRYG